jgi:inosine-uridine nucleoside N-ribohydrolase
MGVEHRAGDSAAAQYRPRGPSQSVLYRCVQQHFEREEQPIAAENPRLTRPTHTTKIGLARLNCLSAHDAVAVPEFVRPGLLTTEYVNLVVDCSSELSRGRTVVDRSGRSGRRDPNARVAVDTAALVRLLIERLRTLG